MPACARACARVWGGGGIFNSLLCPRVFTNLIVMLNQRCPPTGGQQQGESVSDTRDLHPAWRLVARVRDYGLCRVIPSRVVVVVGATGRTLHSRRQLVTVVCSCVPVKYLRSAIKKTRPRYTRLRKSIKHHCLHTQLQHASWGLWRSRLGAWASDSGDADGL
jgi:hypothetical protein